MWTALAICVLALAIAPSVGSAYPANGKIGYALGGDIWTINADGSAPVNLTATADTEGCGRWAPGGAKLAFVRSYPSPDLGLYVTNPDGTGTFEVDTTPAWATYKLFGCPQDWSPDATRVVWTVDDHCDAGGLYIGYLAGGDPLQVTCGPPTCSWDTAPDSPDWSPDGTRFAVAGCQLTGEADIWTIKIDGSGPHQVTNTAPVEECPDYSPDGSRIAYLERDFWEGSYLRVYVTNSDGTGKVQLTTSGQPSCPQWSPDGSKIAFGLGGDIWTVDADGGALENLTESTAQDLAPYWSPDAQKLLFRSDRDGTQDLYVMNRDGSAVTRLTNSPEVESQFGWQEIPRNYPRPKGATPFRTSLAIAYEPCTDPNRTHGPPLAFASCNPPQQASDFLTVGTADANARPALNEGYLLLSAVPGNPATPADEADIGVDFFMDDVFTAPALADYTGELRARVSLQLTDKENTPHPGGPGPGTTTATPLDVTISCAPTAATNEGSSCTGTTSVDAIVPGAVKETRRSIWQLGNVEVYDGGADGDAQTSTGDTLFATQGVFIP